MAEKLTDVPEGLNEEYYQINLDILGSFSKYRPPLNIYRFKEDVARIVSYYRVGDRLSNEQVDELQQLVKDGFIFVSREDHPVYIKHIAFQLDLVLVDKNLKVSEIADIFVQALTMRLEDFFEQPVKAALDKLSEDVRVLTQYLMNDSHKIKGLTRRLHTTHSLANHSFNCGIMGLYTFIRQYADDFKNKAIKRKTFDNLAMGLFLHDLGMTKIPKFVRDKSSPLSMEEKNKIPQHPKVGYAMLAKLDLRYPEVEACVSEHHERMDGSGYPQKLTGAEMSPFGKLCALVDSYCAMITDRPYAKAMKPPQAVTELARDDKRYDGKLSKILSVGVLTEK